jgi:hypothetical protein
VEKKIFVNLAYIVANIHTIITIKEKFKMDITTPKQLKNKIRKYTQKNFIKTGICQTCDKPKKTSWHHKKYTYPPQRKDAIECCRKCHDIIDRQRKISNRKGKVGYKLKRLPSKKAELARLDKIIDIDLKVKQL